MISYLTNPEAGGSSGSHIWGSGIGTLFEEKANSTEEKDPKIFAKTKPKSRLESARQSKKRSKTNPFKTPKTALIPLKSA